MLEFTPTKEWATAENEKLYINPFYVIAVYTTEEDGTRINTVFGGYNVTETVEEAVKKINVVLEEM